MSDPVLSHPEPQAAPREIDVSIGHEERDVDARPVALAALVLAIVIGASVVSMDLLFRLLASRQAQQSAPQSPLAGQYGLKEPPAPRLQTAPLKDLQDLRARDAAALQSYAWVARDAGVVRIPIARAIEILAERGLPARTTAPQEKP